ncbi:MAG: sigma-54-dependent transcriptional regulator [Verrucomicrobiota bacterium]
MNLLIVDDERPIIETTKAAVQQSGHQAFTAFSSRQADKVLREEPIDAILLDQNLGREDGIAYLQRLNKEGNTRPVIVFTAHASVESAVEAMRAKAYSYIQKPFTPEQIRQTLGKLEEQVKQSTRLEELETTVSNQDLALSLASDNQAMQKVFDTAFKAARSQASILLLGPSGTGKTVLARQIHQTSDRNGSPFVTVSCPSLSRELLESELFGYVKGAFTGAVNDSWGKVRAAEGGTLFLDEIGELPIELQPKLLRLLQDCEYERLGETRTRSANIRVITATNRDLRKEVDEGNFREDLFYRLNVISLRLPALHERPEDLPGLAQNFLNYFRAQQNRPKVEFSESAVEAIRGYGWPGNLREMSNVIERAVILADNDSIDLDDLPRNLANKQPAQGGMMAGSPIPLAKLEEEHIRRIVEKADTMEEAARILEIDTATLYRKRKKMALV